MVARAVALAKALTPSPGGGIGLSLHFKWGDQRVGEYFLRPGQTTAFSVGSDEGVDFAMGTTGGARRFELVRSGPDGFVLRFNERMSGSLERRGEASPLEDLLSPDGEGEVTLEPGDVAQVELGPIRLEAFFARVPALPPASLSETLDYTFLNTFVLLLFVGLLAVISADTRPEVADLDDLDGRGGVVQKVLARQAPPSVTRPVALNAVPRSEPEAASAAHSGRAGEAGKPNAPRRPARAANAAAHPGPSVREIAQQLFAGPGAAVAAVTGPQGLNGDLRAAMGHLRGPVVGDAEGLSGLGMRGDGPGGGGPDDSRTIGISLHTHGRSDGLSDRGEHGAALTAGPVIDPPGIGTDLQCGGPGGEPCFDRELIRQVIHKNRGQLRYCYELALSQNHALSGKVSVAFTIAARGGVTEAAVANSDLRSPVLESCVVSRLRTWVFPRVPAGWVKVTYPFVFHPAGQ